MQEAKIEVSFKERPPKSFGGGLYQEWISGDGDGVKFGLNSGAGLGNPMLSLWVEKDGKRVYYDADVRDLITTLVEKVST